jgi:hypothetical protein
MFQCVVYKLLARLVYYPYRQAVVLQIPVDEFKDIVIQSHSIQNGYLVIEMKGEPIPKPLEEISCTRC